MKSDQYVEEIEQTRGDIDRTLHTLENKLSPRELWEQALRWGGGAREISLQLGRTLKDNPIPATLLGISLIWLMIAGTNNRQGAYRQTGYMYDRERLNREMEEIDPRLIM